MKVCVYKYLRLLLYMIAFLAAHKKIILSLSCSLQVINKERDGSDLCWTVIDWITITT